MKRFGWKKTTCGDMVVWSLRVDEAFASGPGKARKAGSRARDKVEGFVHGYVHEHRVIVVVQNGHKMVVAKSAGIEVLV